MWLRDELGAIYTDEEFADLYPERGQPALAPWRLALVTLLQYVEDLTDRQAAEAVRTRLDWKYLLGLELTDPGFDASVLVEFRQRLLAQGAEVNLAARNPMKVQPLHSAAAGRHGEVARLLVDAGADVSARQQGGYTPLHAAAQNGDVEMARLLLARGADPAARNDEGKSPIGLAADAGNTELLKVLKGR